MEELIRFEGTNVHIIQDENGEPLFEIYSTGMALGHIKKNAVGNYYPRKERIDDNLKNAEITPCVRDGHSWINESQLYDFMLEARTDKCRKFRKWVVNEVLPSIRKTGMYTTPKPPYTYSDKTFHGKPVMTLTDISLIFSMNYYALYPYVKKHLIANEDYKLLEDTELFDFKKENHNAVSTRKSVIVIFTSGLLKLISNYNLDKNKIPDAMVTHKGFVVNASVRNLMSYVRKELKGIEALTYLLESNDSPKNLFIYRDSLYRKLDALSHWKTNVRLVKVEPHTIGAQELVSISKGEYGLY